MTTAVTKSCKMLKDEEEERDTQEEEDKAETPSLQENNEQEPLVVDVAEAQHEKPSGDDNQCELTGERSTEVSKPTCLSSIVVMTR